MVSKLAPNMLPAARSIRMLNGPHFKYSIDPAIVGGAKQKMKVRVTIFFIAASISKANS